MDAFDLLDHNCWRLVFRKLDAIDHPSTRLVCTQFHSLLEEKPFFEKRKFHILLPLLIPYLKSEPDHFGYISFKKLKNIRLVCKSWRQSVDKYSSEIYEPVFSQYLRNPPLVSTFRSLGDFEEFHQWFGDYLGNPFPSNRVEIWAVPVLRMNSYVVYIQKITDFMERYGRHIYKLELYFYLGFHNTSYLFVCKLIKSISEHLPNLKAFRIICFDYDNYKGPKVRDDPEKVAAWIGKNALPDLPKLRALKIKGLDEALENYLVEKYSQQLTHFERNDGDVSQIPESLIQLNPQLFPNMRKLALEIRDHTDTLEYLRFLASPLKVITLFIRYNNDEAFWNVDEVLCNLKHLPLECLKIILVPDVNVAEAGLELEDYLNESIQTCSLHFICFDDVADNKGKISFNFLQAFTKLEKLKVSFKAVEGALAITHPEDVPEEVDLLEYLVEGGEMPYQSNIWEKVPSLKTLIRKRGSLLEWHNIRERATYSREKYEAYSWQHEE